MDAIIGYVALFVMTENGKYIVEFPDLPGCYTQGDSLEVSICKAQEALAIYYQEQKGKLPPASSFATILKSIQETNLDAIPQMVVIETDHILKSSRTIKKTLTIPEWLNTLSEKYQVNFSQILKNALISHLKNLSSISSYDRRMLNE